MNRTISDDVIFHTVFEWNASKIIEILASLMNVIFVAPFYYYAIWYEKVGANHCRSLINQLVSSSCASGLAYILFAQSLDIMVTAFGPFSLMFCHFRRLLKSSITQQIFLMTTAISIVKYVFLFVLKSPPNSNMEFWNTYISLWTLIFSFLYQFVYQFLPGRNPINIYLCSGSLEKSLIETPAKVNHFTRYAFIVCIAWFIFAAYKIQRYKKENHVHTISLSIHVQQDHHLDLSAALKDIFKNALVNISMMSMIFTCFIPALIIPAYLNNFSPEQFNSCPVYQLYHFMQHGMILLMTTSVIIIYYLSNPKMQKTIIAEMRDDCLNWKDQIRDHLSF